MSKSQGIIIVIIGSASTTSVARAHLVEEGALHFAGSNAENIANALEPAHSRNKQTTATAQPSGMRAGVLACTKLGPFPYQAFVASELLYCFPFG